MFEKDKEFIKDFNKLIRKYGINNYEEIVKFHKPYKYESIERRITFTFTAEEYD